MNIKAKFNGLMREFEVENYVPIITDINELLADKKGFLWNRVDVEVYCSEVSVEWNEQTDNYCFYEVQTFNAVGYDIDSDEDEDIDLTDYYDCKYIAVLK